MSDLHWRDTARPVLFFGFDARMLLPLCVWAFHMCVETFVVAVCGVAFFLVLSILRLRPASLFGMFVTWLVGTRRPLESAYFFNRRTLW